MTGATESGTSPMERFRRYYSPAMRLKYRAYRSQLNVRQRLLFEILTLIRPVWQPLKHFVEMLSMTGKYGRIAASASGLPATRQLRDQLSLYVRLDVRPKDYYLYELYRRKNRDRADTYIFHHQMESTLRYLKQYVNPDDLHHLGNKIAFRRFCESEGLESIPILCEILPDDTRYTDSASAASPPGIDLFSKPADMGEGMGVKAWTFVKPNEWYAGDGNSYTFDDLVSTVREQARRADHPFILQPRTFNHPEIERLTGSHTLCSARLITCRTETSNHELVIAIICLPVGNSEFSNISGGNLAAPINLETGILGPAHFKDPARIMTKLVNHPDTGSRVAGFAIPHWKAGVQLALNAHAALNDLPFVGWDVGFSPTGPVLIEGNRGFDSVSAQLANEKGFGETRYPELFDWHIQRFTAERNRS